MLFLLFGYDQNIYIEVKSIYIKKIRIVKNQFKI